MKANGLIQTIGNKLARVGFGAKKHSPEILIVAGITGTIVSAVIACKATLKINSVLEEMDEQLDIIRGGTDNEKIKDQYSEEDKKKDLTIVYVRTGLKVIQIYAPAVIIGTLSLISILASNNILRKRNTALGLAYMTVSKGFKKYRANVVKKYGSDIDRALRFDAVKETVVEKIIDENGKEIEVEKEVEIIKLDEESEYAKYFDESSPYWQRSADYNLSFLKAEQAYANNLLRAKGYVFLNEIYERLGIKQTKAGQVVGWVYDQHDTETCDNFIDFGIYRNAFNSVARRAFVNGYEPVVLLDFNVDGCIWERDEVWAK